MLELFKPYMWLEDKNKTLIFNEVEQFYIPRYKSNRPFIIFYDKRNNEYYYIKSRTANKNFPENKLDEEVFIPSNVNPEYLGQYKGVLINDSWVDCSQIFKIDADLLESLVDINNERHIATERLEDKYISKILDKINECCNEIPPNLSIIEVKYSDKYKETYANSLYLSPNKLKICIDKLNKDIYPWETIRDINDFISIPNAEFTYQRNRYNNAIEFIKMFQKEYFYDEFINTDYQKKYFEPFFDNSKINDDIDR